MAGAAAGYDPSASALPGAGGVAVGTANQATAATAISLPEGQSAEIDAQMRYICGDCGQKNIIRAREPVRCRSCGYRILYKMRTEKLNQYDAI